MIYLRKWSILITFFIVGCAKQYHVPPLLVTDKPYAGIHYECESSIGVCVFARKVPQINPYTFRPSCSRGEEGYLCCESYYSVATGIDLTTNNNSDSIKKQRILARDLVVNAVIATSIESSSGHQAGIQAVQSSSNLFFKFATAALTAAGTVATGGATQVLSAAASGTNAAQLGVSEEIYQKKLAGSITNTVIEAQKAKLIEIYESLATKDSDEYNVQRGIADALEFHELGSFYKALEISNAELTKATVKQSQQNDEDMKNVNKAEKDKTQNILSNQSNEVSSSTQAQNTQQPSQ